MRTILFILTFFLSASVFGQNQQIDSLLSVSQEMQDGPEKVKLLLKLADLYNYNGQQDTAEEHINEAMSISKKTSYVAGEARCLWKLADLALNTDVALAKQYLQKSLDLSYRSNDDETIVGTLNELGYYYLYYVAEQSDSTLYFFEKSLEINNDRFPADLKYSFRFLSSYYTRTGDNLTALDYIDRAIAIDTTNLYAWNSKATLLTTLGRTAESVEVYLKIIREGTKIDNPFVRTFEKNLASVYASQGNYQQSLYYAKSALEKEIAGGDLFSIIYAQNQVGNVHLAMNQFDSAEHHLRKAISLIESNSIECQGNPIRNIAFLKRKQGNYDSALVYYHKAQEIYESCANTELAASNKLGIIEILILLGEYNRAEGELKQIQEAIDLEQYPSLKRSVSYNLYDLYKKQNRFQLALEQFEKNRLISDSLFSAENDAEIARLEANHEFENEKSKLIAKQETEKIEFDYKLRRSQQLFYLAGIGFLIVGIFAYTVYLSYRKIKKARGVIAQKNNELEKTTKELKDLSEFKQGMTNMIAHDIKNPLNSIISLAGRLSKKEGNDISRAGGSILRLVTNMLDVEKFENANPKLSLQSTPVSDLISEASLAVELLLHDKSIKLETKVGDEAIVEVDREMMIRVFVNLLSNAIKFSPSNAKIEVTTEAIWKENRSYIQIAIRDHGLGIPKEDQPYLFDKFYQTQARKSGMTPSTGLGLTFCKMAILAHEGEIDVSSEKDMGSTFLVSLEIGELLNGSKEILDKSQLEITISNEEKQLLKEYSLKLKALKVHNVGAIMPILDEVESLNLQSDWASQLRSAVQYANGDQYRQLIALID